MKIYAYVHAEKYSTEKETDFTFSYWEHSDFSLLKLIQ